MLQIAAGERKAQDDYQTPTEVIEKIMPFINFTGKTVLEPAVGKGNIVKVIQSYYPKCDILAADINEEYVKNANENLKVRAATVDYAVVGTFSEVFRDTTLDIIITNPPYSHAQEFIEQSMKFVNVEGLVIMLLRLNFLGSQKRKPFYDKWPVSKLFVLSERPSFTDDGQTDATDYGWFVWSAGKQESNGIVVL